jgi:hypothetical protein
MGQPKTVITGGNTQVTSLKKPDVYQLVSFFMGAYMGAGNNYFISVKLYS